MKFLVIIEAVPGGPPMPPEQFLPMARANQDYIKRLRDTRKVEVLYALADHCGGFMGGCGIVDYDSAEQLAEDSATMPAAGLVNTKVYPLVGWDVVEKLTAQLEATFKK